MKIGLLGLGKMGFPLALNIRDHHSEVVAFDPSPALREKASREAGITVADGEADLVRRLEPRRVLWLMELTAGAFAKDPHLDGLTGRMHASGEGQWTVETALDLGVPAPVIALAVMMRFRSLEDDTFAGRLVAALRHEFGGHAVEKK